MAYGLVLVDASDNTLFDFNSSTGTGNPGSIKTFCFDVDYGSPTGSPAFFATRARAGGKLLDDQDELVTMSWKQGFSGGQSADSFRAAVAEMFRLLKRPGHLKVTPIAGATPFYIDFEFSPLAAQLRGQNIGALKLYSQLHDPDGMPLSVVRQPYFRRASLSSSANKLTNASFLLDSDGNGRPDGWTWSSTASLSGEQINAATESYQWQRDSTGTRTLDQTVTPAASGETWTGFFSGAVVSGTGTLQMSIQFLDAADVVLQTSTGTSLTSSTFTTSSVTATAPVSTAKVRFRINNTAPAVPTVLRVRRARLAIESSAGTFINNPGTVSNDPGLTTGLARSFPIFNPGTAPTDVLLSFKGLDAASKIQNIHVATKGSRGDVGGSYLSDWLNAHTLQLESGTLTNNTTSVADADASSGNVAQVSTTNALKLQKRVRITRTTKLDSLRGAYDVYLRLRSGGRQQVRAQLRWSPSLQDPAPFECPEIIFDTSINGLSTFGYSDKKLGRITIDETETLAGIAFEVWVGRYLPGGLSAQTIDLDCLVLVPTDFQGSIQVPYVTRLSTLGKDVDLAPLVPASSGSFDGDDFLMDQALEQAVVGFGTLAASRYRTTIDYSATDTSTVFDWKVVTSTSTATVHVTSTVTTTTGQAENHKTLAIEWDATGAIDYAAMATWTSGGAVTVHSITLEQLPYIAQNQYAVTDPGEGVAQKRDSSSQFLHDLDVTTSVPVTVDPGLNMAYVHFGDVRKGGLPPDLESVLARSVEVTYTLSPKDYA